jgi:hypothetical protein
LGGYFKVMSPTDPYELLDIICAVIFFHNYPK